MCGERRTSYIDTVRLTSISAGGPRRDFSIAVLNCSVPEPTSTAVLEITGVVVDWVVADGAAAVTGVADGAAVVTGVVEVVPADVPEAVEVPSGESSLSLAVVEGQSRANVEQAAVLTLGCPIRHIVAVLACR